MSTVFCDVKMATCGKAGRAPRMDLVMYWPMVPVAPKSRMRDGIAAAMVDTEWWHDGKGNARE